MMLFVKKIALIIPALRRLHDERNYYANLVHSKSMEFDRLALDNQELREKLESTHSVLTSVAADHTNSCDALKVEKIIDSRLAHIENQIESIIYNAREEQLSLKHIHRKLNAILQRTSPRSEKIKVVFCVYYQRYWSTLEPIYLAMDAAADFDPVVVTIRDVSGQSYSEDYFGLTQYLNERGIPYLDWSLMDSEQSPSNVFLLENIDPDVVFKQTHWEGSEPRSVRSEIATGYRVCYIPYGFEIADTPAVSTNQEMHHAAWRLFLPSELHVKHFKENSLTQGRNAVAVGHPRLDAIEAASAQNAISLCTKGNKFRVLWAPIIV